ncbi:hypothetical protein [Clostridium sp. KNHs214]|uniref:hypothetical protein n=1 Tax=Clostridium sp. KNHs214 TaxID=1540257 RepID=UPI00054D00F5|nr:hypothetical protein [Clostridium sp. KNHs214]
MKIGRILKGTGRVLGTVVEYNIKITGEVVGAIADIADKPNFAKGSRNFTRALGNIVGETSRKASDITGDALDRAIDIGASAIKRIEGVVVKENIIEINEKGQIRNIKYVNDVDYEVIKE